MTLNEALARIDWLEGTALPHARKQSHADGFQVGWHAALTRVGEGDSVNDLREVCPAPPVEDALIATVEAVTREWQPIGTHPKDSRWLLGWEYDQGCFVFRDGPGLLTGEDPMPTHWMPLPAPPVEGTSQTENSTLERPQCPQCKKSTTVSQLLQYGACCDCSEDAPYDEVEGTSAQDDQGADHGRTPSR